MFICINIAHPAEYGIISFCVSSVFYYHIMFTSYTYYTICLYLKERYSLCCLAGVIAPKIFLLHFYFGYYTFRALTFTANMVLAVTETTNDFQETCKHLKKINFTGALTVNYCCAASLTDKIFLLCQLTHDFTKAPSSSLQRDVVGISYQLLFFILKFATLKMTTEFCCLSC